MSSDAAQPSKFASRVVPTSLPVAVPVADEIAAPRSRSVRLIDFYSGRRKYATSAMVSAWVHFAIILALGIVTVRRLPDGEVATLSATFSTQRQTAKLEKLQLEPMTQTPATKQAGDSSSLAALATRLSPEPPQGRKRAAHKANQKQPEIRPETAATDSLLTVVGGNPYGMFDGRDGELKQILLADGGTPQSEEAVARGLRWIAAHQRSDGSWHFNHALGEVCLNCSHPGHHGSTTAATGLALLPFLGAGQTHRRGEHQDVIRKGLEYLKRRVIATPLGGDLQEGTMYAQAIATLALCEAYALTGDRELLDDPCRQTIAFIVNAQDKNGGGWRYFPGQFGDTTVTGWMLMALKSGQMSYLPIPAETWKKAWKFLDSVEFDSGAAYGYLGPKKDDFTMSAIGLLCRMYGGWPRRNPSLIRGVQRLSKHRPSLTDLYYDYYATMVVHHYGGEEWNNWNTVMRDHLVKTQGQTGHEAGSWYFPDVHGDQGGRLYNTAMALLILEVYYRHLPIYGIRALGNDFNR